MKKATLWYDKFLFLLLTMFLSGCAVTLPTTSYTPQNFIKASGKIDMGTFQYMPFIEGKVKKSNQMQNTAAGQIYLSMDISDYSKRGTALELEKSGVVLLESANFRLDGNVIEFMADDLGYSIDLKYAIQYKIVDKNSSQVLFDKTFIAPQKKIGKFGDAVAYTTVASEMVLSGYELFIRDGDVKRIFEATIENSKAMIVHDGKKEDKK